jgi:hypothetical protein
MRILVVIPGRAQGREPGIQKLLFEIPGSPSKSAFADLDNDIAELG